MSCRLLLALLLVAELMHCPHRYRQVMPAQLVSLALGQQAALALTHRDANLLVGQVALEGLALALATPDAQDEGHLDLGQVQEVLGHLRAQMD